MFLRAASNNRTPDHEEVYSPLMRNASCEVESDEERRIRNGKSIRADYETAISATGYGKFHYWLLLICGWANAADAVEVLCVSFLLPSAECDLKLSSSDKGWLSAMVFIGMMVGGYLWGALGDNLGRKEVLIAAMCVNALFGMLSSLALEFPLFLFLRFMSGLGVGGSIPVTWSYYAEFQPKAKRGAMLSFLAAFWMIGNFVVAGLAWIIIPQTFSYDTPSFQFNSWRLFTAVCGLPSLTVALLLLSLPESPRYLLAKGKAQEALQVFQLIFAQNTGKAKEAFPYLYLALDDDMVPEMPRGTPILKRWSHTARKVIQQSKALFASSLLRPVLLMIVINFTIQFGYYGLWLWFPELFSRLTSYYADHPDASVSVCDVVGYNSTDNSTFHCNGPPDNQVFINAFILAVAPLPANVWTILHMDKLGRKFFLVFSMVISGLCAFLIWFVSSSAGNLAVSCVFGAVSTMGFNALDCLGTELFPTSIRSTALAITLAAARLGAVLGNIVFGVFVDYMCALPILLVATLLIGGGLLGLLLPNTTREPLE